MLLSTACGNWPSAPDLSCTMDVEDEEGRLIAVVRVPSQCESPELPEPDDFGVI